MSERIVSRALFLLRLPSQAGRVSSQEQSKRRWSILAKLGGQGTMTRTTSQSYYLAEGGSDSTNVFLIATKTKRTSRNVSCTRRLT